MSGFIFVCAVSVFAAFAVGTKRHFKSTAFPSGMVAVSFLSIASFLAFTAGLMFQPAGMPYSAIGLIFIISAGLLFTAALRTTRAASLKLAFDRGTPASIIRTGPYKYVRHPFYASYLLFWAGCLLAAPSAAAGILFIALTAAYAASARLEERDFSNSPLAAAYADYCKGAGLFWPKPNLRRGVLGL